MLSKSSIINEKIIQSATLLLKSGDINSLTMRNIATDAGIALGTIYCYFKSKEEILIVLSQNFWIEVINNLDNMKYENNYYYDNLLHLYNTLLQSFNNFDNNYIFSLKEFSEQNKKIAKDKEKSILNHFKIYILNILNKDSNISPPPSTTLEDISQVLCDLFIFSIMQRRTSIDETLKVIKYIFISK